VPNLQVKLPCFAHPEGRWKWERIRGETVLLIHSLTHSCKLWRGKYTGRAAHVNNKLTESKNWKRLLARRKACGSGCKAISTAKALHMLDLHDYFHNVKQKTLKRLFQGKKGPPDIFGRPFSARLLGNDQNHERIRLHLPAALARGRGIKIRCWKENVVRFQVQAHGPGVALGGHVFHHGVFVR